MISGIVEPHSSVLRISQYIDTDGKRLPFLSPRSIWTQ